jgi:hypothetical protein
MSGGRTNRRERRAEVAKTGGWGVFRQQEYLSPAPENVAGLARQHGVSEAVIWAEFERERTGSTVWRNAIYQVAKRVLDNDEQARPPMVWLSIKRIDRKPVGVERFRDFQRIKNELVGPDYEGVELYPAESRLVDTSNQYHLWVVLDAKFRFPFGYENRLVTGESVGGAVQRPFSEDAA